MVMKLYSETDIQNIADAIRSKNSSSDTYTVGEMAHAIEEIKGGLTIDDVVAGNYGDVVDLTVTSINRSYVFAGSTVKTINAPNLNMTTGTDHVFANAKQLETINMPNNKYFGEYGCYGCSKLQTIIHPYYCVVGQHTFHGCSSLTEFIGDFAGIYTDMFRNDAKLKVIDCGPRMNATRATACYGCTVLDTLIIRRTENVVALANINMFGATPFASGKSGGTLYVPQALISDYQAATNWSTILGYTNNQILPIEGSEYEHYYADGTPISE